MAAEKVPFGKRLQELREAAEMSQEALATASGIPAWTLRGYEQERRIPLAPVIYKLAAALDTDCSAFANCSFEPKVRKATRQKKG